MLAFFFFFPPFFDSLPACLGCVQLDSSQRTHIQTFYGWMIPTYFTLSSVIFVKLGCYNAIYSLVIQDGDGRIRREKIQNALLFVLLGVVIEKGLASLLVYMCGLIVVGASFRRLANMYLCVFLFVTFLYIHAFIHIIWKRLWFCDRQE